MFLLYILVDGVCHEELSGYPAVMELHVRNISKIHPGANLVLRHNHNEAIDYYTSTESMLSVLENSQVLSNELFDKRIENAADDCGYLCTFFYVDIVCPEKTYHVNSKMMHKVWRTVLKYGIEPDIICHEPPRNDAIDELEY